RSRNLVMYLRRSIYLWPANSVSSSACDRKAAAPVRSAPSGQMLVPVTRTLATPPLSRRDSRSPAPVINRSNRLVYADLIDNETPGYGCRTHVAAWASSG